MKDYEEAKQNSREIVVFGSLKFPPLVEIYNYIYDTAACSITKNVFNPCKRLDREAIEIVLTAMEEKLKSYQATDPVVKESTDQIGMLRFSITVDEEQLFYEWSNKYGAIFDSLDQILDVIPSGQKQNGRPAHYGMYEQWTYEKNMDYWRGVIEVGRSLVLISPIIVYGSKNVTTIHELLWLYDHGYNFEPMFLRGQIVEQARIIAIPPTDPISNIQLTDYFPNPEATLKKFNKEIKQPLMQKIKQSPPLSTRAGQCQMAYNKFVVYFNDYFGSNFPTEHQNIDLGISSLSTASALEEVAQQQRQKPVNRPQ